MTFYPCFPRQEEILALTISYISLLHNQLVGRVRTHGETYFRWAPSTFVSNIKHKYFRQKLGASCGITERSSKEDIIKYLHRMLQN